MNHRLVGTPSRFDPVTQSFDPPPKRSVGRIDASRFAQWKPYRPPWYPYDDNPWEVIGNMSGNVITRYSKWAASLPPGELLRRIDKHRAGE